MRRASTRIAVFAVVGLAVLAAAAYAYDSSRSDLIAKGVRAAGVPVGGLHAAAARSRLRAAIGGMVGRPLTVVAGSRRFNVPVAPLAPRVDVDALVQRAVAAGRGGFFVTRAFDGVTDKTVSVDVPAPVHYRAAVLDQVVRRLSLRVDRPARDAQVQPSTQGLARVRERDGLQLDSRALRAQLAAALALPEGSRTIRASVSRVHPRVTMAQLAARNPSYVVVDRGQFELRLYRHLKLAQTWPIAVGMQGLETPAGLYHVQWMQVNPPWYVPNSAWAGSLAGRTIPPGPQDPLKARFISFNGAAGIHGIDPSEYGTIGQNASHGCVRMRIPDVIDLYRQVAVGTPVYVG